MMLCTQLIIQVPDMAVGLFAIVIFLMIDIIGGTENDVVPYRIPLPA
jgi:hypothetical protein